jgi:hypothetical protein
VVPTVDRTAVAATISSGVDQIRAVDVELLCLRWEDVDGDGYAEWVGAYGRGSGDHRLGAFVIDGGVWHELAAVSESEYGLGGHPECRLEVRDTNLDGKVEILVWGRAESDIELLHLFAWDGTAYVLLAAFAGDGGIATEEKDGQLGEEIVVGHRVNADLVWQIVYAWDGVAYGWTWDRHAWFFATRPHAYDTTTAERAVISFYLALDDRDLPGAFRLLSDQSQRNTEYREWAAGFATTIGVEASSVQEIGSNPDGSRVVSAQVLARDNLDGRIVATWWDVVWTVVGTGAGWRLHSVETLRLDRRELEHPR